MNGDHIQCAACGSADLRGVPPRDFPAHFICRSCRAKFAADYHFDPENDDRVLVFGARHNPEVDRQMADVGGGLPFDEAMRLRVARLNELKAGNVPMLLPAAYLGYVDVGQGA